MVVSPALVNALAGEMRTNRASLRAAASRVEAARHQQAAVRTWEDPWVRLGGMGAGSGMRREEGDIVYGVEQKLPLFGRPRAARQTAAAELALAQESAERDFQNLRRDLAQKLFQAALADTLWRIQGEDLTWLRTMAAAAEPRYAAGEIPQVQLFRLRNECSLQEAGLVAAAESLLQEHAALNRLLGRDLLAPWPPLVLPPLAGEVAYRENLVDLAVRFEPQLKVLRQDAEQARATVEQTRRQRLPEVTVGLESRSYSGNGDLQQSMLTVGLSLPWLNAGKYRSDLRRDQARLRARELEADDYAADVREEVRRLVSALAATRRRAQAYEAEVLPRSEQALLSTQAAWVAGRGQLYDLLESRRMVLEARSNHARAIAEQYTLLSDLTLCCGLADLEALQMIGMRPGE